MLDKRKMKDQPPDSPEPKKNIDKTRVRDRILEAIPEGFDKLRDLPTLYLKSKGIINAEQLKDEAKILMKHGSGYLKEDDAAYNVKLLVIKALNTPGEDKLNWRDGEKIIEYRLNGHYSQAIMKPGGYETLVKIALGHRERIEKDYSLTILNTLQKYAQKWKKHYEENKEGLPPEEAREEAQRHTAINATAEIGIHYHNKERISGFANMSETLDSLEQIKVEERQEILRVTQNSFDEGSLEDKAFERAKAEVENLSRAGCLTEDPEFDATLAYLKAIKKPGRYSIAGCEKGGEWYMKAKSGYQEEVKQGQELHETTQAEASHRWLLSLTNDVESLQQIPSEIREIVISDTTKPIQLDIALLKKYAENMDNMHLARVDQLREVVFEEKSRKRAPVLAERQQRWSALYKATDELAFAFGRFNPNQRIEKLGVTIYLIDQLNYELEEDTQKIKNRYKTKFEGEYKNKYREMKEEHFQEVIEEDAKKRANTFSSQEKESVSKAKDLLDEIMLSIQTDIRIKDNKAQDAKEKMSRLARQAREAFDNLDDERQRAAVKKLVRDTDDLVIRAFLNTLGYSLEKPSDRFNPNSQDYSSIYNDLWNTAEEVAMTSSEMENTFKKLAELTS